MPTPQEACRLIDQAIRSEPAYAHTSHLLVEAGGEVVFDRHYRGPRVADVFSVTKSVVATLCGTPSARDAWPTSTCRSARSCPPGRHAPGRLRRAAAVRPPRDHRVALAAGP